MRIIHCADLHLDSKLNTNLDREKARIRRSELINSFRDMVQYASDNDVKAILISGDLFDTKQVSETVKKIVTDTFVNYPNILFFYLRGNHDENNFISSMDDIPNNVRLFDEKWTAYSLSESISVYGMELNDENDTIAYSGLVLDADKFNIVMLHGQESQSVAKDKADVININALKNKNIDYLALGHIHSYKVERLDSRGTYAYPGCLEGRGFDECGKHGFIVLDVDEYSKKAVLKFVAFARREVYEVHVNISNCANTGAILDAVKISATNSGCTKKDMLKVVLEGETDVNAEKNTDYIADTLREEFFGFKIEDISRIKVNYDDFALDESLKGEFVRLVYADDTISDEDKAEIIKIGFITLDGGDPV